MSLRSKGSINIITPVLVKSIVTEQLITSIKLRISESLESLNSRMNQIEYQKEFYSAQKKQGQEISMQAIESLKRAENEVGSQIKKIEDQAKQVDTWKLGQEVVLTQKESLKQYEVGDSFIENQKSEIVVKDGIIVEIRE